MRVEDLLGFGIEAHAVDSQVAAQCSVVKAHGWVGLDSKATVTASYFIVAPRKREVYIEALYSEYAKLLTDSLNATITSKDSLEGLELKTEDFEVEVLRVYPEKMVSDPPTHEQCSPASSGDGLDD